VICGHVATSLGQFSLRSLCRRYNCLLQTLEVLLDRNSTCARYVVVEPLSFTRFVRKTSPTVCPMHPNPYVANHFGGALNSKSVLKCAKCTQCIHTSSTTRFKRHMSTVFPLPFLPKAHPWHPSPKAVLVSQQSCLASPAPVSASSSSPTS
jgi:hypothetical protein